MSLFKQYKQPNGSHHPLGNRRVYSTKWLNTWVNWERDNAMTGPNGEYLTSIRPRDNGKQRRIYLDMSMANIEIDLSRDRVLQWGNGISTDPTDTKYMRKRYLGTKSLYECSHMPTNDFLRHIESLPCRGSRYPHGGKK